MTGINQINQVTNHNVRAIFYLGRTERKWSVNTFIVYHKTLLVFFRWCIKQGYMDQNPIIDIEIPKKEVRTTFEIKQANSVKITRNSL